MSPLRRFLPSSRRAGSEKITTLSSFLPFPPENPQFPLTLQVEVFTFKSFTPSTCLDRVFSPSGGGGPSFLTTGVEREKSILGRVVWRGMWSEWVLLVIALEAALFRNERGTGNAPWPEGWGGCGIWGFVSQASKCTRWMPRHRPARKDVASCEKLRGAASEHRSGDIRMGQPGGVHTLSP